MQKRKVGRPSEENGMKAGQLQPELCRFTIIIEKKIANALRIRAAEEDKSIKDLMKEILEPHTNHRIVNLTDSRGPNKRNMPVYKQSLIDNVNVQAEIDEMFKLNEKVLSKDKS